MFNLIPQFVRIPDTPWFPSFQTKEPIIYSRVMTWDEIEEYHRKHKLVEDGAYSNIDLITDVVVWATVREDGSALLPIPENTPVLDGSWCADIKSVPWHLVEHIYREILKHNGIIRDTREPEKNSSPTTT